MTNLEIIADTRYIISMSVISADVEVSVMCLTSYPVLVVCRYKPMCHTPHICPTIFLYNLYNRGQRGLLLEYSTLLHIEMT